MKALLYIISLFSLIFITACNLEKEIDINLPDYESQLVLECYLEPGQPFALSLSRSAAYFDSLPTFDANALNKIFERGAQVTITHNGKTYQLEERLVFNPFTQKLFNYYATDVVPANYEQSFELKVVTKDGKTIEATTRLLPVIPIDSVVVEFSEKQDTLARVLTYLTDPSEQENFYRRMLHNNSLDSLPEQDFVLDDRLVDGDGLLAFGTGFDYTVGDTVINTAFHLEKEYYNFLESVFNARDSNGNPFGQPSPINSNLRGTANAIGIFRGL
ncbi:MAG: DUF4249 domain-containing protein, partial [Saprospiraceae bacterium]